MVGQHRPGCARDSPHDQPTIAEVLTAFVRHRATVRRTDAPDGPASVDTLQVRLPTVQAAMSVLGRMPRPADLRLDLTYVDLHGAQLGYATLTGAQLGDANLTRAILVDANLTDADLRLPEPSAPFVELFALSLMTPRRRIGTTRGGTTWGPTDTMTAPDVSGTRSKSVSGRCPLRQRR